MVLHIHVKGNRVYSLYYRFYDTLSSLTQELMKAAQPAVDVKIIYQRLYYILFAQFQSISKYVN